MLSTNQPSTALTEGPTDYRYSVQPLGKIRAIMIFVDFPDAVATTGTGDYYNLLVPGARRWYAEASYGRMSLAVTRINRWFRMPRASTEYNFHRPISFPAHRAYISDAIAAADSSVDFRGYQLFYIVPFRTAAIEFSPGFRALPGGGVVADGRELRFGATFGNDIYNPRWGWRVLRHETGHTLGLPDLYDFDTPVPEAQRFVGWWDPMSAIEPGAHFLAWQKYKLGWLNQREVACVSGQARSVRLSPLATTGGTKIAVIRTGPSTAIVAEVRQPVGQESDLCDKGVLVYKIDANQADGHGPIRVHPAHTATDQSKIARCGPLYNAPFDLGAREVSRFHDPGSGVTIELRGRSGRDYRVRITRQRHPSAG